MRIKFYLLDHKSEIFQTFQTLDQMTGFLSRLRYIKGKSIFVSNGKSAIIFEDITDNLAELNKKIISAMNILIKA